MCVFLGPSNPEPGAVTKIDGAGGTEWKSLARKTYARDVTEASIMDMRVV